MCKKDELRIRISKNRRDWEYFLLGQIDPDAVTKFECFQESQSHYLHDQKNPFLRIFLRTKDG